MFGSIHHGFIRCQYFTQFIYHYCISPIWKDFPGPSFNPHRINQKFRRNPYLFFDPQGPIDRNHRNLGGMRMKVGNNETNSPFTIEFAAAGQFSLSEIKYYCQVPVRRLSTGLGIKDSNTFKVLDVSDFIPGARPNFMVHQPNCDMLAAGCTLNSYLYSPCPPYGRAILISFIVDTHVNKSSPSGAQIQQLIHPRRIIDWDASYH
jgi:hypothetical protein